MKNIPSLTNTQTLRCHVLPVWVKKKKYQPKLTFNAPLYPGRKNDLYQCKSSVWFIGALCPVDRCPAAVPQIQNSPSSRLAVRTKMRWRLAVRGHGKVVSWCLKPSPPQRIISGLRETFIKRYIVERTNEAELRPEEKWESEVLLENLWNEIQLKGQ